MLTVISDEKTSIEDLSILLVLRVVGHLPWLLACCELGWAGVGQASGEETAGGLRSVFLQMWSMEI